MLKYSSKPVSRSKPRTTQALGRILRPFGVVLVAGQLFGCFAPQAQPNVPKTDIRTEAAKQPELLQTADLAAKLQGIETKSSLKVEQVSSHQSQALLTGELSLDAFVDFKQPLKATLTVRNPSTQAVALRYHSGMTADLLLTTVQGKRLWAWSDDMMFTQALRDKQLAAGEELVVRFAIPPKALAGIPNDGAHLEAQFAAKALESELPAMAPVVYLLTLE
ncbi:intracellular proteinase inhibitor domain protein [Shewanella sp. MR-4]|uniref:BsuPI-related putative proteinase inhibitor n=1 Tax=Shewanella sp. (strain MR-4) TaxID=60480 RepID=UPI00005E604A|nr:BsuPI-related putative proteinase inhibitor [Shewanella sp. MR-4]ABI39236.1 intracellular proteinase inhibitor domain protein [Shewanella sp. MR-4]